MYTQDNRFSPLHNEGSNVWMLKITNPQVKDSGEYECQVSYHDDKEKKLKMPFRLVVLGKLFCNVFYKNVTWQHPIVYPRTIGSQYIGLNKL